MKDQRLEKLAQVLTQYSTQIKKGDIVCISGEDASIPFIQAVAKEATKLGGIVKYFVDLPETEEELLKWGTDEQVAKPNFRFEQCAKADVWISAWGTNNVKTLQKIDGDKLKKRRLANACNRKIYSDRMGNGSLRWCGTQFPTRADAQYASMSLSEYEDFVYQAGFLNELDPVAKWKEHAEFQKKWIEYLNRKSSLHIIAPGTDLTVGISGRKWISCCGQENFPDGEIFTSPVEDSIDGTITFSYPAIINGWEFEKVTLTVERGVIRSASCQKQEDNTALLSYIDTDEGSRRFGEVAIGTNYGIKQFTHNILFDEKIGGSMHMAIGQSMPEAGGKNESAIHWDMINDLTQGGKLFADGELFYENGAFIPSVLEH